MAAEELKFSPEVEAELHPRVIILSNDLSRFAAFANLLEKSSYPCTIQATAPETMPAPGTVFFISFNLKSTDAVALTRMLEQKHKFLCIVFAEEEGTKTATKLSSAKMTQTLQYPYTEKNFVMAMQTIVKNRRAQAEKDLRRRQHAERMKARQTPKVTEEVEDSELNLKFENEAPTLEDTGAIVQRGPEKLIDDDAKVFKGEAALNFFVLQGVNRAKSFVIVQEGEPPRRWGRRESQIHNAAKRRRFEDDRLLAQKKAAEEPSLSLVRPAPERSTAAFNFGLEDGITAPLNARGVPGSEEERPASVKWAIVALCLFGSAICLYCVQQILFGH